MEPASKVGGDLFDAFFVDSRTLFVCIGDVSGHGIAAALFMVRVIGLLRVLADPWRRRNRKRSSRRSTIACASAMTRTSS